MTNTKKSGIIIVSNQTNVSSNTIRSRREQKMIYGYCRISRKTQDIERQVRNIISIYPTAKIYKEAYTGTKVVGRTEWLKIYKYAVSGDTIVFDSVSRMSRDSTDGWELYKALYDRGVNLVFLKEPHINTDVYRKTLKQSIPMTGTDVDCILQGVNQYLMILAQKQIQIAFEQAEKEVQDLHQRTSEGIETARRYGKQIGAVKGKKLHTKQADTVKDVIKKHHKDFGGTLSDLQCMQIANVARNTYYKYKKELLNDIEKN